MWMLGKNIVAEINKVHPLTNLREISFGQLFCVPEACRQLDCHKITTPNNLRGTKSSSLNLFSYFSPGAYSLHLNVDPSVNLARHAVTVCEKQKWTMASSSSDAIAFITDNSTTIGRVQIANVEEEIVLNSGVKILQHFLGAIDFRMLFICCVYPRLVHNSTFKHAQVVARVLVNKKVTKSSLKLSSSSSTVKSHNRVTNYDSVVTASAVTH